MTAAASYVTSIGNVTAPARNAIPALLAGPTNRGPAPGRETTSRAARAGDGRRTRRASIAAVMTTSGMTTSGIAPRPTSMISTNREAPTRSERARTKNAVHASAAAADGGEAGVGPAARAMRRSAVMPVVSRARPMPTTNRSPQVTAAGQRRGLNPPPEPTRFAVIQTIGRRPTAPEAKAPAAPVAAAGGGAGKPEPARMPRGRAARANVGNHPVPAAARAVAGVAVSPGVPAAGVVAMTLPRYRVGSTRTTRDSNSWAWKRPFARRRPVTVRPKTTTCLPRAG